LIKGKGQHLDIFQVFLEKLAYLEYPFVHQDQILQIVLLEEDLHIF